VEDDQEIRNLLVDSLSHIGYDGVKASDSEAGFQCALEEHPDIILLDATMPIMGGFEVLQKLKSNPTTSTALIIIISAMAKSKTSIPH
jgi:DNA-binding response OmpR family regulator